jgi:hypothetical protein
MCVVPLKRLTVPVGSAGTQYVPVSGFMPMFSPTKTFRVTVEFTAATIFDGRTVTCGVA